MILKLKRVYMCQCVRVKLLHRVRLCVTYGLQPTSPPLSMGILRARILEWVAVPPPGNLPHPGMETASLTSSVLAGRFFTTSATWEHVSV